MTFRFAGFLLLISVCSAQNDGLEGSGEGSGEGDLLTPENLWQLSSVQQDGDGNDILEFTGICMDSISFLRCPRIKFVKIALYHLPNTTVFFH